jgi:predicted RNase H-like HicB family nuclease
MTQVAGTIWTMKFTVAVTHEAPWYVARCLDVDVVSQGETVDDAVANLEEALGLYFEGEDLPDSLEPPIITTVLIPA